MSRAKEYLETEAQELEKMYSVILAFQVKGEMPVPELRKLCRQCALIAVEEIIKDWDKWEGQETGKIIGSYNQSFWQEVKQALENK